MFQISRRKFFGLFGGAAAAAAIPKPLMAMEPSMIVSESTASNITIEMLQSAYAQSKNGCSVYVQHICPPGIMPKGPLVYWVDEKRTQVSAIPYGRNGRMRYAAGMMNHQIYPDHYGWIQVHS